MQTRILAGAAILAHQILLGAPLAGAQWINQPTVGIPRTADGKPHLTAPAPRTAEGTPDLSGLWLLDGFGLATNITDAEMLPAAKALYQQRLQTYGHDDPVVHCLPEGPRTSLAGFDPVRIVQTRYLIAVLYELGPFRQIHLDGRALPVDPQPTWMGYSIGRWEGDTLVVETAGYNDKTWLDFNGHPHSEALRVTERFRRIDFGHAEVTMTFDDPQSYVKPWSITVPMVLQADTELIENICQENEKSRAHMIGRPSDEQKAAHVVPRETLARYVGAYAVEGFGTWMVSVDGDQLRIAIASGGGPQPVIARSDTVFIFPPVGGSVRFVTDARGVATSLVVTVVEGDLNGVKQPR